MKPLLAAVSIERKKWQSKSASTNTGWWKNARNI
jgi:hypothetical protein